MHRARKRFGQHFLHDRAVISRILDAIAPEQDDFMVEIGPGLGAMTLPLLQRLRELHAIEIDRDAIHHLRELAGWHTGFHLHEADVLDFKLSQLQPPMPGTQMTESQTAPRGNILRIVGNLPYNISTPLLFRLIAQREHILDMHFMLQKEVVDRMAASAGSEHYGRLSVMLAPWVQVQPLFDIGPGAFRPAPRVQSTFVRLRPLAYPLEIGPPRQFATVVAAAFSQRRKTLRNALRSLLSPAEIMAAGIDPSVRAEVIPATGFAALSVELARKIAVSPPHGGDTAAK